MAAPLITTEDVVTYLKGAVTGVEVFDEFPSDMKNVRHGIYVDDPSTSERVPYQLGVQNGAHIYTCVDSFRLYVVTFQGDKKKDEIVEAITSMMSNDELLDGYHERDFTMEQQYLNRAEYRTYDFELSRIEFQ
jgi:hypothetical protein